VSIQPFDRIRTRLLRSAQTVFLLHGYEAATMGLIAEACEMTRRGLYHHFHNKEEMLRGAMQLGNFEGLEGADKAARALLSEGGSAVDVIAAWLDARFGRFRRAVGLSPHGEELNDVAFRLAADIMIEVSHESQKALAELMDALATANRLKLRAGLGQTHAARLIVDGARGVNQMRPPIPSDQIAQHYREVTEAILYGCADF
jgi:AcrR family transcriptional regulator